MRQSRWAKFRGLARDIRKRLHRMRLDYAAVIEILRQNADYLLPFGPVQLYPRQHLRQMPAHFLLARYRGQCDQKFFAGCQIFRVKRCDFFHRVRSAHSHNWVIGIQAFDKCTEQARIVDNIRDDFF